jgi:hypothetical protein
MEAHCHRYLTASPWSAPVQEGLRPRSPDQADHVGRHADRPPRPCAGQVYARGLEEMPRHVAS